jgi:hypothetical protein
VLAAIVETEKNLDLFAGGCQRADRRGQNSRLDGRAQLGSGEASCGLGGELARSNRRGSGRSRKGSSRGERNGTGDGAERYHFGGCFLFLLIKKKMRLERKKCIKLLSFARLLYRRADGWVGGEAGKARVESDGLILSSLGRLN